MVCIHTLFTLLKSIMNKKTSFKRIKRDAMTLKRNLVALLLATSSSIAAANTNHTTELNDNNWVEDTAVQQEKTNTESITPEKPLNVYLSLYAFAAQIDGSIGLNQLHTDVNVPFKDILKNLDNAYMFNLDVEKGGWGAYIDKQYVKTKQKEQISLDGMPIIKGDIRTKLNRTSIGTYYQAFAIDGFGAGQKFYLEPTIGVHFTDVSASIDASLEIPNLPQEPSASLSRSTSWTEAFIGTRYLYDFNQNWNVAGQVDFGTKKSQDYQAYLGYRTKIFNQPTNLRLGYRMIKQNHTDNGFQWKIKEHGPALGLSIKLY